MAMEGNYIPVERGTLTFPWGANRLVIEVIGMQADHSAPTISTLGPADLGSGKTTFSVGDRSYKFNISGKYTNKTGGATIDVVQYGEASIQFGTGEKWTGNVKVVAGQWRGRYPDKKADCSFSIVFDGKPTIVNAP